MSLRCAKSEERRTKKGDGYHDTRLLLQTLFRSWTGKLDDTYIHAWGFRWLIHISGWLYGPGHMRTHTHNTEKIHSE